MAGEGDKWFLEWFESSAPMARYSTLFRVQLGWSLQREMLSFFGKNLFVSAFNVFDEVRHIESPNKNPTSTKPTEEFKGRLAGIFHKHWFQASFLAHNLADEVKSGQTFDL